MKRIASFGIAALALALSGCESEPEETPDLTEAIPLEDDGIMSENISSGSDLSADYEGARDSEGGNSASGDASDRPAGNASGSDSQPRRIPETMESGSNPPGVTEPPKGSKVQRFN